MWHVTPQFPSFRCFPPFSSFTARNDWYQHKLNINDANDILHTPLRCFVEKVSRNYSKNVWIEMFEGLNYFICNLNVFGKNMTFEGNLFKEICNRKWNQF